MADDQTLRAASPLIDTFGRHVTYLRMSVTDRCDLRCTYCMAENMTFLPKRDLLTLEELDQVAEAFIERGVRKIRITGGEPLVRKGVDKLFAQLGSRLGDGLDELTLTTNGTLLSDFAERLADSGVKRINVSLDTLDPDMFREITRRGDLKKVLHGMEVAQKAGLRIKLNTVALKHQNAHELPSMIEWAHANEMDMTLIEVMPLGETGEDRIDQYTPLPAIQDALAENWTLEQLPNKDPNSGPSRYVRVKETGGKLGFITPLTNNFCAGCNRIRMTCTGRIYMCLGQDNHVDLRQALRSDQPVSALDQELNKALFAKPENTTSTSQNAVRRQPYRDTCPRLEDRMANLLYFGRLADVTGKTFDTVTLPAAVSTVAELRAWLDQRHDTENVFQAPEIKVAINNEFVDDNSALEGAQEIAFMPPVGGG